MASDYMEALRVQLALADAVLRWGDFDNEYRRREHRELLSANPVFVAPWVSRACDEAAASLPQDAAFEPDLLPCDTGFAVLGNRPMVRTGYYSQLGAPAYVGAIKWHRCRMLDDRDGVRLLYLLPYEGGPITDAHGFGEELVFGDSVATGGLDFESEGGYDGPGSAVTAIELRRLIYALWAFMRERRATTVTSRGVDRALRKQAERSGWTYEPIVQVVELRASQPRPHEADGEHASVDWACRWAVRGHWRRQPYPSKGVVRAKWIPAHVKGPEGKPLKAATKLLAVVR